MPTRSEIMRAFIPESPFAVAVGLRLESLDPDRAVLVMPFASTLATLGDVVHGGAIATLVDAAATAAAWASDEVPDSLAGATVSLSVNYLAAARGRDLVAAARVRRRGGRLCFVDVEVTEDDGGLVAHGIATYRLG